MDKGGCARFAPHPNPLPEGARGPIERGAELGAGFLPLPVGEGRGEGHQRAQSDSCKQRKR
ncbi:hypothetical protein EsCd1HHP024_00288 [Escherichia sp. HH091_1A]|nr:hypothetical protein EsCd1HHP024_00288 [Escherichia sp. HH091_1A]